MSNDESGNPMENRRRTRSASRALSNNNGAGGEDLEAGNANDVAAPAQLELMEELMELQEDAVENEEEVEEDDNPEENNEDGDTTQDEETEADDEDEEDTQERVEIPSEIKDDEEVSKVHEVQQVLKVWEDRLAADANSAQANDSDNPQRHIFNPVSILTR